MPRVVGAAVDVGAVEAEVLAPASTTTTVSAGPITYGTDALVTVTVSASIGAPTGTVSLSGTGGLLTQPLGLDGTATFHLPKPAAGDYTLIAVYQPNGNFSSSQGAGMLHVGQASQNLSFTPPGDHTYGDAPLTLSASASSGLPVQFHIVSGPASLSGDTLSITGAGTIVVEASQPGDGNDAPAAPVDASFNVTPAPLLVLVDSVSAVYGQVAASLSGRLLGVVNGDPIAADYSSPGTQPGIDTGTYSIQAGLNDGGTGKLANYSIAIVTGLYDIAPAPQQLAWPTLTPITYGAPLGTNQLDATVSVVGPASAGALTYNHAAGDLLHAGTQTLTVTAAATRDYLAATLSVPLVVLPATPTVAVQPVTTNFDGQAHATTGEAYGIGQVDLGPVAIRYSTSTGSAPVAAGSYVATGTFAGNADYTPATGTAPITIAATAAAAQRLAFDIQPGSAIYGTSLGTITVRLLDASGNQAMSSAPVTLSFASNPGSAMLVGMHTVNAVQGVATFTGLSVSEAGAGYTLSATSPMLTASVSSPFTISALAPGLTRMGNVLYVVGGAGYDWACVNAAGAARDGSTGVVVQATLGGQYYSQTFGAGLGALRFYLNGGGSAVGMAPSLTLNTYVSAGNGFNAIQTANGNDIILAGDGGSAIVTGDGNDIIRAGNGFNFVQVGNGQDVISVGNNGSAIFGGNGNDVVLAGNGYNFVQLGDGADTVALGTGGGAVFLGKGPSLVAMAAPGVFVQARGPVRTANAPAAAVLAAAMNSWLQSSGTAAELDSDLAAYLGALPGR
jgi:hypothetical protein